MSGRVVVWACRRVGVWAYGRIGRMGVWAYGRVGVCVILSEAKDLLLLSS